MSDYTALAGDKPVPTYAEQQTALVNELVTSSLADDLADVVHDQTTLSHMESLEAVQIVLRYLAENGTVSAQVGQRIDLPNGVSLCVSGQVVMPGEEQPVRSRRLTLNAFAGWSVLDD